jgi:hypothetical protein
VELGTTADIKLATRAFNQGWKVSPRQRREIVQKAMDRATCGDPDVEDKAGKLLLAIDKFNHAVYESEQKRLDAEHARKLQLIELAVKLGIVVNAGAATGAISSQPSGSVG